MRNNKCSIYTQLLKLLTAGELNHKPHVVSGLSCFPKGICASWFFGGVFSALLI